MNFATRMATHIAAYAAVNTATQLVLREDQRRREAERKKKQHYSNNKYRYSNGDQSFIVGSCFDSCGSPAFMPSVYVNDISSVYSNDISSVYDADVYTTNDTIVLDKIRCLKESEILIIKEDEFNPVIESYLQDYEQITRARALVLLDKQDIEDGFYYMKKPTYKLISKEELLSNNENIIEDMR